MRRIVPAVLLAVSLGSAPRLASEQVLLLVDSTTSSVTVHLTITALLGSTSTDTVPVSGFLLLDLDAPEAPNGLASRHFDIHGLEALQFENRVLLFSKLYTTASNLQFFDAFPGPQARHDALTGNAFTSTNKWFLTRGSAVFTGASSGTLDLKLGEPLQMTGASGTFQTVGGTHNLHLDFPFSFTQITVDDVPLLGTVTVDIVGTASINAQAAVGAPPPPAPALNLERMGASTNLALYWPSALWPTPTPSNTPAGYWPWRTTNLVAGTWAHDVAPLSDDGTNCIARPPLDVPTRFYRLEWR